MRKAALSTAAILFFATVSSQALADEPLPQLPPPAAAPAPAPAAPPPTDAAPAERTAAKPSGVTFDMGLGVAMTSGQIVQNLDFQSVQSTVAVKLGVYVSQHVGFSLTIQGGFGSMDHGFDNAYSVAVPVRVEYAWKNRFNGAYVDFGVSPLNKFGAFTDTASGKSSATLEASSPLDYGMGLGYRVPFGTGAVDLHGGFDWGKFDEAKVNANGRDAGGTIDPAGQATHWALNLGVAYRFGSR